MAYMDKSTFAYAWSKLKTILAGKADKNHTHSEYANQNAFSNVKIGDTTVVADTTQDTLTLEAGSNVTITPDATNDKIVIAAKDTTYGAAGSALGLVKSGGDVTIADGVITVKDDSHAHTIANVDGLQDALDGKEASGAAAGALAEAKTYADGVGTAVKADLLGGAGAAYDTLKELADLIGENDTAIDALETVAAGKADADHTHKYAGSSTAGGAATSANKLNTNAGSTTQPVYFANGVPVKTTHTLGASVPAGAKFTDTVYTHPASGVTAGTYRSVTVNAQGHVTGGSNPTTLAGYGITDAVNVADVMTTDEIDEIMDA